MVYTSIVILQEIDPCEDVTDEDIRMAIQNATGPKGALFVPEVSYNSFHICGKFLLLCPISANSLLYCYNFPL